METQNAGIVNICDGLEEMLLKLKKAHGEIDTLHFPESAFLEGAFNDLVLEDVLGEMKKRAYECTIELLDQEIGRAHV